ncbi:hypothetical protein IMAU30003_00776 [Lactobacillus helveticus]|uniref:Uncharacterized protein n=1 Tax=Lactobacillus helveticus TaxID=1587 RepID=A0A9Q5C121_LACHE|nr:hypothetical protein [Lactobacillus helveticus]NRO34538.1 hypothetical protein [Lactobacillus helveticus]NRO92891.1 hypothetical protein [Lactobacillus helveticus]
MLVSGLFESFLSVVELPEVELPLLVPDVLLELLWLELPLEPLFVVELLLLELVCLVVFDVSFETLWCVWFKESEQQLARLGILLVGLSAYIFVSTFENKTEDKKR